MKLLNEIQQSLVAPKNQNNSAQGYKYRSCEDILEAVKPLLNGGTLVLTDEMIMLGNGVRDNVTQVTDRNGNVTITHAPDSRFYIKATVTLSDGTESVSCSSYAREPFNKKGTDAPKLTGTASSYARKYALCGLFCIDDNKDPDTDEYGQQGDQQQPNNNANQNQQGAW